MAQTSKAYIDDLLDMSDPLNTSDSQSNVSQYYKGRNVLVTGGSGFLGILLIERLLRQVFKHEKTFSWLSFFYNE